METMVKPLFYKVTSDHLLLCVFLSLLWGATADSSTSAMPNTELTAAVTHTATAKMTSMVLTTPVTTIRAAMRSPSNTEEFKSVGQNETSITLQWRKVENLVNYTLVFNENEINVTATMEDELVTKIISGLTSGTKYNISLLFSVFEDVRSSGVNLTAVTAPSNTEEFKSVGQNETSITLQWRKVENLVNYTLVFNENEINVTATMEDELVTKIISGLTSGTKYNIMLFSVFEDVRSSGVNLTAVTAPSNTEEFKSVGQNETSITLQWKKVENIVNYTLVFNGNEINVTATTENESVTKIISNLTSGTKYDFTLFTVFEDVRSSGVNLTAVTAPSKTEEFKSVGQNETSITLQWKKVENIVDYTLVFNGNEINVTATTENESVTKIISNLTSGTKYDFTLFTVFEDVRSSGVNLTAVTAPSKTEEFKSVGQNETSITLQWKKVENIVNYTLVFNGNEINVTATTENESVTKIISNLTSGTKYDFTLFTVFEDVRSSGVNLTAVTAPSKTEEFKSVGQNETSITLQWRKVENIVNYALVFNGNEINVTATTENESVTKIISNLTSGTKYNFSLFSVFEDVRSSGVNLNAVTATSNTEEFKSVGQNETSITLQWRKVENLVNYALVFNENEINVTATMEDELVTKIISGLTSGTKYNIMLFSVIEDVRSSGVNLNAVTAPNNTEEFKSVGQNETSITLQWRKVENILSYKLVFGENEINVTATTENESVTKIISNLTSGTKYDFTLFTVFEDVRSSGVNLTAVTAPSNTEEFKSVGQNETSITLQWRKVENIVNYTLVFNGNEINVTATTENESVTKIISNLTSGTKYNFSLFSVFEDVRSSGVNLTAVTAPSKTEGFKSLGQNETSITLQWRKVENIFSYELVFNGNEINVTATMEDELVTKIISGLTSGTKYNIMLFSVFEDVRSSGVNLTAVTAPNNTEEFKSVGQNETSITLQWRKVENILSYKLVFGENEINVTAAIKDESVTKIISNLTSGTKYDFTLFTMFEDVRSSGVKLDAVTAPRNAEQFKSVGQNETSITLKWKKVENILSYKLAFGERKINVTAAMGHEPQTYTISNLTSGTKYDFSLFSVFEDVRSSGVNLTAVTAPSNTKEFKSVGQNETSITLQWRKVENILSYKLVFNENEINVTATMEDELVTKIISGLTSGTKYNIMLFSVFEDVRSSGVNLNAVTAPSNTEEFKSVGQNETSITLQWRKVENILSYKLVFGENEINVTAAIKDESVTKIISNLTSGNEYDFSVFSVFEDVRSSGVNLTAVTVPPRLTADCEYWDAGYSIFIVWDKPDGVWTSVEVNVTGKTHIILENENGKRNVELSGFAPARTYEVSLGSLSRTIRSSEPYVFLCNTDPRGVIAGSVLAVLLFVVLVCLAVFILLKRPDLIRKKAFTGGSKLSSKNFKAISIAQFPDHFSQLGVDDNRGFSEEYESLVPVGTEQTRKAALLPENKAKNRFNNVLPYDWCRVKLTPSNPNPTSDYINASYMPGYNSNREYIATQGPLPATVNDFWRMIWEQKVNGIVMVTNCTEGGRTKCEQYWPADSNPFVYGELLVTMRSERQEPNWTLREFSVKPTKASEERTVKHFHFTAWPDHGVPQGTKDLIQFRGLVRSHIEREGAVTPTVVHCSAGVGRTGTIIALDVLLQQLDKKRAVGINAFVHKMRLSRPYMVQTESQYVFLHQCIMDRLQPDERTEESIYENADMIYANATVLREFRHNTNA